MLTVVNSLVSYVFDSFAAFADLDPELSNPVNIRNILKWSKHLQNVFKINLSPILWFSKYFQVNAYSVMFKKCFINILYTNVFTENIY